MKKMKAVLTLFFGIAVMTLNGCAASQASSKAENKEDWRLCVQAYTFKKFTLFEAIDKTASLGLKCIETYRKQPLSPEQPDVIFNHTSPPEVRKAVREKLKQAGVKLVNYGVIKLPNDEKEARQVFDFAKDMGIETITSEPKPGALNLVERLCEEYGIKVAIHNHPAPSQYWNPDTVLQACRGRSKLIGVCADTGHWMRSGVNPVEALKKLEGRIISLHFKDLNKFGTRKAHDVVWGTGKADVKALLTELKRQNFKGVFSIEYEYNWEDSVPEIRQSIEYFNKVAAQL
ncbi:MAG: sugar phosphate isomerase/epimerase family protein [Planctomycetota bacterium]|jgi:sugar phosphate isomerase/epimerase